MSNEYRKLPRFYCDFIVEVDGLDGITANVDDFSLSGCKLKVEKDSGLRKIMRKISDVSTLTFIHEDKVIESPKVILSRTINKEKHFYMAFEFITTPKKIVNTIFSNSLGENKIYAY